MLGRKAGESRPFFRFLAGLGFGLRLFIFPSG
jgi:hypothetical protein